MVAKRKQTIVKSKYTSKDNLLKTISLVYIFFLSLFALDVFGQGYNFSEIIVAILIHLIPSFILLVAYFISLKDSKKGSYLFILVALLFTFFFKTYESIISFSIISIPVFVIGVLFFLKKDR